MRRIIFIGIFITSICYATNNGKTTLFKTRTPQENKPMVYKKLEGTYKNDKNKFEIYFPKNWYYIEEPEQGIAVSVQRFEHDTTKDGLTMTVSAPTFEPNTTTEQFAQKMFKLYSDATKDPNIKMTKLEDCKYETYKISVTMTVGDVTRKVFTYFTIQNKMQYHFMGITELKTVKQNEILFDKTYNTLTIK